MSDNPMSPPPPYSVASQVDQPGLPQKPGYSIAPRPHYDQSTNPQYGRQAPVHYGGQAPAPPYPSNVYTQNHPPQPQTQMPPVHYQPQSTTVVISQPTRVTTYGPTPLSLNCPHCNAAITTSTSTSAGTMVLIASAIICFVGIFFVCLWLGCCLIPFCVTSLHDVTHRCPNCQRTLGTYKRANF